MTTKKKHNRIEITGITKKIIKCPKCGSTELTKKMLYDEEGIDGFECDSCGHTAMDIDFETDQMTAKHTPGPWKTGGPVKSESIIKELSGGIGPNGLSETVWEVGGEMDEFPPGICVVNDHYDSNTGVTTPAEANARLIAAAPEMLVACETVIAYLDQLELGLPDDDPLIELRRKVHKPLRDKLEPAIRKARGE